MRLHFSNPNPNPSIPQKLQRKKTSSDKKPPVLYVVESDIWPEYSQITTKNTNNGATTAKALPTKGNCIIMKEETPRRK